MFTCPTCRTTLERTKTDHGLVWTCTRCGGHAATVTILRKNVDGPFISGLWEQLLEGKWLRPRPDRPCPSCAKAMSEITTETITGPVQIDVCRPCQFFWFDLGEAQQLPALPPDAPEPELHPRAREALALAEIEAIRRRHEPADLEPGPPDEWWKILATLVGLPSEEDGSGLSRKPFLTWGIGLLILLTSVIALVSRPDWIAEFGLVPADPFRHGGTTFLTSFLLHGGWWHLAGNLYFLIIFGDNVEDAIGRLRYLVLLAVSALVGDLCHYLLHPDSTVPLIGASGGISGVILYYALAFPRNRIGLLIYYSWFQMSARWAIAFWVGAQVVGVLLQLAGVGKVAYLAHLGGAVAGVAFWLLWRERPERRFESFE